MDINLTEFDRKVLLLILDEYVTEYGSKDWPIEQKNSVKNLFKQLQADEKEIRFIGGILK